MIVHPFLSLRSAKSRSPTACSARTMLRDHPLWLLVHRSVPPSSTKQPSSPHCLWSLLKVWPGGPLFSRLSPEPPASSERSTTCQRQQQKQPWQTTPEGLCHQACT